MQAVENKEDREEIEVTPQMIAAGVGELWGFDSYFFDPKEMAKQIFLAMKEVEECSLQENH